MKELKIVGFVFLFLTQLCSANMASPIIEGSKNASAFSSKNVTILHENIIVHISQDFKTATYTIEYTIKSDLVGGQIPLLFLAKDYKDNFNVWLDEKMINVQCIPSNIIKPEDVQYEGFANSFSENIDENKYISITWQRNKRNLYNLDDLKYFEADLSKGEHKIKVEYTANVWIDKSNEWINEYSFRYSLAPAKFWKSFGSIDITVFQDGTIKPLLTNLGSPIEGDFGKVSTWKFNKLPSENFNIVYKPKISKIANVLIAIEPFGIMILVGIVLLLFHIAINFWYKKKIITKKVTWIVVLGSFIVPYLMLHSFFISYDIIDNIIGADASQRHGYYFLILFVYPILVTIYMIIMWIIDIIIRKKLTKSNFSHFF